MLALSLLFGICGLPSFVAIYCILRNSINRSLDHRLKTTDRLSFQFFKANERTRLLPVQSTLSINADAVRNANRIEVIVDDPAASSFTLNADNAHQDLSSDEENDHDTNIMIVNGRRIKLVNDSMESSPQQSDEENANLLVISDEENNHNTNNLSSEPF